MYDLEFVLMINFRTEILQNFHRISQHLQSEDINLQKCADLYGSLSDDLSVSRNEFDKYEAFAREILPDVIIKQLRIENAYERKCRMMTMHPK